MADKIIAGPYEYGDQLPPLELFGWLGPAIANQAYEELLSQTYKVPGGSRPFFRDFLIQGQSPAHSGPPIWEYEKVLLGGKYLETNRQEVGDCVAHGAAQAGERMAAYEIVRGGQEEELHRFFPPYIYACSRVDIGGSRIPGDGSTGAWGAAAMQKLGILFSDDEEVPVYSGSLARNWGRSGAPQKFKKLAKDNPVKSAARLRSVEQIREALINHYPCTFACMWDFQMQPIEYRGYHCFRRGQRVGGHQTCLLAWISEPFEGAYLLGSWGPAAHGTPLNGEPPGGAWVRAEDLKSILRSDAEVFALSQFEGFPGEENWSPL